MVELERRFPRCVAAERDGLPGDALAAIVPQLEYLCGGDAAPVAVRVVEAAT